MKVEIDLTGETPELSGNAKRAQDRFEERRKLREYGDMPEDEVKKKEEEKEKEALKKEKREQDNPPTPSDLGKFKPEKFETLEEQLAHTDRETNRNL